MSKIVSFIILSGLVLAAVVAFNVGSVNAREETKFVQFSVLAKDQANYGVDENPSTIPAVSPGIIEEKVKDTGFESNLPIIRYTSLPAANPEVTHQDNDNTQSVDEKEAHGNSGNHNGVSNQNQNQNQNNNGNNGSNQNNGKGKEREKEKEKATNLGGGGNSNSNTNQNANSGDGAANSNDKAANSDK